MGCSEIGALARSRVALAPEDVEWKALEPLDTLSANAHP